MKRNIRTTIIVAVLLAVLVGAYIFLQGMKKEDGETPQQVAEKIEYIIEEPPSDVASVQFNTGELNYTIHNGETPTVDGYTSHIIDSSKLDSVLMNVVNMSCSQNMGEQSDLSKYGLDKEDKFVLIKFKNGEEHKIIVGNPTYVDGEYYVRKSGEKVVYTLPSQFANLILCHPKNFRDTKICVVDNYSITEFAVEQLGEKVLEINRDDEYAKKNGFIQSNYIIKHPYENVEANNDTLNAIFENLTSVYATEIVEEDPQDLAQYGLHQPYAITVKDNNGKFTVKMGTYAEDGTVYVMRDDIPVVFKASCPFYEPVKTLIPDEYIARYIHIFKITEVEGVTVEGSGKSHNMKITKKSSDSYEYKIDDKIKAEDNFRSIYNTVISPIANQIVNEEITGEEVCKITFTLKDKTEKTFVYHKYDDRNYITKANNGLTCLVKKESVDDIFKALK